MAVDLYLSHKSREVYRLDNAVISYEGNAYEVQERIRSGGNAVVHKCADASTGDEYAIKFNLAFEDKRTKRFQQEIKLLKEVEHDQIIKCIDNGEVIASYEKRGDKKRLIYFLIMPVAESNLLEYVRNNRRSITYSEYMGQFKGICSALSELHVRAVHRDLKPENILLIGDTWYLSDLGLCKYTAEDAMEISYENEIIGPRYWMSPEAINRVVGNGDEITERSDVFQLASIFWFVVTGRHPQGVLRQEDWTGPGELFDPIYRSLAHNPDRRSNSANDFLRVLEEAAVGGIEP